MGICSISKPRSRKLARYCNNESRKIDLNIGDFRNLKQGDCFILFKRTEQEVVLLRRDHVTFSHMTISWRSNCVGESSTSSASSAESCFRSSDSFYPSFLLYILPLPRSYSRQWSSIQSITWTCITSSHTYIFSYIGIWIYVPVLLSTARPGYSKTIRICLQYRGEAQRNNTPRIIYTISPTYGTDY